MMIFHALDREAMPSIERLCPNVDLEYAQLDWLALCVPICQDAAQQVQADTAAAVR